MYNARKTVQAAAVLIRASGGLSMPYLRLIKLLYLADRRTLKETGRQISDDRLVAMKHGPVLSETYDKIKNAGAADWQHYIKTGWLKDSQLVTDPGIDELSEYELRILTETAQEYRNMDRWQLRDYTHTLPEWVKNDPGRSSKPIPIKDILEAVGLGNTSDEIIAEQSAFEKIERFLSGLGG